MFCFVSPITKKSELRKSKNIDINMRIGIHSGMVQSGIIGMHKWQFDIWSMDCLLASQMEQDGVPGCLHITKKTFDLLPKDKLSQYKIVGNRCIQKKKTKILFI